MKHRINLSSRRMTNIKAGHSIVPDLKGRDWKTAVDWAVSNINIYDIISSFQ